AWRDERRPRAGGGRGPSRPGGPAAPRPFFPRGGGGGGRGPRAVWRGEGGGLGVPPPRHKPHLYSRWVSDLVRHPAVLDAVESLIGPDILVWRSIFFVKPPRDPRYVAWHQDSAYWGLSSEEVVTAWIALTESTADNGCLRVVAGSHRRREVRHGVNVAEDNGPAPGQKASIEVAESDSRSLELQPGEMSLHPVRMLHGSGPNASAGWRVGLAVR